MVKSVAMKMGIKEGMKALFIHAPAASIHAMGLPSLHTSTARRGDFDYIHLFVIKQAEMKKHFPLLKKHLRPDGMLWVSWPKNKQLETDLSLPKIIEIGYGFGLVESTCLRVDDIWSGLKFTRPKAGKVYQNSYGKLSE